MTIEYSIDIKDFLEYQLYVASKSERIRKKRMRNKILVPLIYLGIGIFSFSSGNLLFPIGLILFALLWFFIYPLWEKNHYVKHYENFLKENYKERAGRNVTLELNDQFFIAKDGESESKIAMKEVAEINEIPSEIFIKLKTGPSLILPKDKIKNIDEVISSLKELSKTLSIPYTVESDWEWK